MITVCEHTLGPLFISIPFLSLDLNTLHWGRNNVLSVALGGSVYLWNPTTGTTSQLVQLASDDLYVSSVSWADTGKYLAVGISNGDIQVSTVKGYLSKRVLIPFFQVVGR